MIGFFNMDEKAENKKMTAKEREAEILKFWQDNKIFEKTEGKGDKNFIFYDGPPFANGEPHYGHMLASTIKDAIPRYQVMKGRKLRRRWGWDCHGLPVENLTEKELGLKGKKEIEEYGIEKFNEATRINIMRDSGVWEKQIPQLGRFVDMENDYKTMDSSYTESVWWSFKTLYDKKLAYKGFKSMHLCPRCGTTLSNFEVNLGYKDITDLAVTIPFEIKGEGGTYFLAWTTTPWTLPGNMALGVNSKFEYVKVSINDEGYEGKKYILAKERAEIILKNKKYQVLETYKGSDLVGKLYTPLFNYYEDEDIDNKKNAWKVYEADFVTLDDGTGIVHEAPAFGADDLKLAEINNIPIVHHVGYDGKFKKEIKDFKGLLVKPKDDEESEVSHTDTDVEIIKYLAHNGKLFAKEKITHSYPHCWRCETPLLNYATDSWFVKVTEIKDRLVEENKKIHWVPENVGQYRFGNWLEGAHDWAISRSRYWGAPLPVWEGEDGKKRYVMGSLEDLRKYSKKSGNKYFVMRHGEAESNISGTNDSKGNSGNHLTENGRESTIRTAKEFSKIGITKIITSPFLRAKESAEIFAHEIGLTKQNILSDKRLIEFNHGSDQQGKKINNNNIELSNENYLFIRHGDGDSHAEVRSRVVSVLFDMEKTYKNETILIVTHGSPMWMLITGALGMSNKETINYQEERKKDNGEYFISNNQVEKIDFVPFPHNKKYELDFHRPYIDEAELIDENGEPLKRIPEVFDCWYESGSMPYAQDHYPFEKNLFDVEKNKGYPADFIAEGLDQTRGWFYSLLVLGVALFDKAPYKNVIVNGLVLAEDGEKMSKRLNNYPDSMLIIEKYGADALRYYMLSSPIVRGEELRFSEKGVSEIANKIIGRILNVFSFWEMYKEKEKVNFSDLERISRSSSNVLDRWIIARLSETNNEVSKGMELYELDSATRPLMKFVEDFSTWYLRRSRDRFKGSDKDDKKLALATTHYVLLQTAKLFAPTMPFIAEDLYQKLKTKDGIESVHLEKWPVAEKVNEEIITNMSFVRSFATKALMQREKVGIKIRQPLSKLIIKNNLSQQLSEEYLNILKEEVNVKEIVFEKTEQEELSVSFDTNITQELKEEGIVRDVIRLIQDKRKEANLVPKDEIIIFVSGKKHIIEALSKFQDELLKVTNSKKLNLGSGELKGEDDYSVELTKIDN
ncbi:MAG: class I tRNA ligase family protein [Patescibacteria group bacterium]